MFQRIRDSLRRFMDGRNGADTLACALLIFGLIINLAATAAGSADHTVLYSVLYFIAYIPFILAVYRIFSRDVEQRRRENDGFRQFFLRMKGRRYYCYFRCPDCRTRVRVPRGKGKIRISCPSCHSAFIRKT